MELNSSRASVAVWVNTARKLLKEVTAGNNVTVEQQKRVKKFLEDKK